MIGSPRKDCNDRYLGCHSDCEKYKNFRDEIDRLHELKEKDRIQRSVQHRVGYPGFGTGTRPARKRRPKDAY